LSRDYTLEYLKKNKLLTGDPVKDRRIYIETNWCGDVDPDEELDAELESELPEEFQNTEWV
jgi:hypothetical protein